MYRTIDTSMWYDTKITPLVDTGNTEAIYLFIYLFANSHAHLCGLYHITKQTISSESGLNIKKLDTLLDTLSSAGLIRICWKTKAVYVRRMFHRQGKGSKNEAAALNHLQTMRECPLLIDFFEDYPHLKTRFKHPIPDRVSIGYPKLDGVRYQEQEQEQEQNVKKDLSLVFSEAETTIRKVKTSSDEYSQAFKNFWNEYPVKGRSRSGIDKTWRFWKRLKAEAQAPDIMRALAVWKISEKWLTKNGQFVEGPHIWLNDGRWKLGIE